MQCCTCPVLGPLGPLRCECCERPVVERKSPGIGYYCDDCLADGCDDLGSLTPCRHAGLR